MKPVKNISCNYLLPQFVCLINVYAVNICNIYHRNIFLIRLQYLYFLEYEFIADIIAGYLQFQLIRDWLDISGFYIGIIFE